MAELCQNELKTFEYLAKIAETIGIKGDDDKSLLANEYAKIETNDKPQSALFAYLNADLSLQNTKMTSLYSFLLAQIYRNLRLLKTPF